MPTNQLIAQPIVRSAQEKPPAKSWFSKLLDTRKQAKETKAAINSVLADSPDALNQFASTYSSLEIKEREKTFARLTNDFASGLTILSVEPESAITLQRMTSCLEMICSDVKTISDSNSSKSFADTAGKLLSILDSVLEDQTECRVYHQNEGLILASASLRWVMTKDVEFLKNSLRDPMLQQWVLEIVQGLGNKDLLVECACFNNLIPMLVKTESGRDAVYSALSKTKNGHRAEMVSAISITDRSSLLTLLNEWVVDADRSQYVFPIALKSSITNRALTSLAKQVYERGQYGLLEEALNMKNGTALLEFVSQTENGSSMIKNAIKDSDDHGKELLSKLAAFGEGKIKTVLAEWSKSPDTLKYFFTTATMLDTVSPELEAKIRSSLSENMQSRSTTKAARKAYLSVMAKEMHAKAVALKGAFETIMSGMSEHIKRNPGLASESAQSTVQFNSVTAVAGLNVAYSKEESEILDAEIEPVLKTAALNRGLQTLFESILDSISKRPKINHSEGKFVVQAGPIILNVNMKVEFTTV